MTNIVISVPSSDVMEDESLKRNTQNVIALFTHWKLKNNEECNLLGGVSMAQLAKLKKGTAIISGRDTVDRVGNLLGIHKSLRILYPHNREVVYRWIRTRNRKLHNLTPLDVMLEHGYIGIAQIRRFTDHMRGQ
jgi:hypothetical protein